MFNIRTFFSKDTKKKQVKKTRSFKGAARSRFTSWLTSTFAPINRDLKSDLQILINRSRDLAKNNEIFRSHLNNMQKSIIGSQGFRLQSLVKNPDGTLNEEVNKEIEYAWWDYGKNMNGYISKCGQMGDIDLDILILRTLVVDGEAFIHVDKNAKNPYGISFELIDSLKIDFTKDQQRTSNQNAIVMGVEIDEHNKPVNYYFREGTVDNYQVGKQITIPADEIIHIYKHEFVDQTRGFGDIVASIDSLKQLDDYAVAELFAAKVSACQGIFYERNGSSQSGDMLDANTTEEDQGVFVSELSPGEASIVPTGYTVKSVTPTHPNTSFSGFVKSIIRRIASSVGVSYNRLAHDYEAVNYSSLREASLDEAKTYSDIQRFLIDNWKTIQYSLWLKSYVINSTSSLIKPSHFKSYLDFSFIPRKDDLFDAAKDIVAVERRLKLGLTNPIMEIEARGNDVDDVLDGWIKWNDMLKKRKISFSDTEPLPLDVINQINEEINHPEKNDESISSSNDK